MPSGTQKVTFFYTTIWTQKFCGRLGYHWDPQLCQICYPKLKLFAGRGWAQISWQVHFLLLSYARKLFCCFKANFSGPFHGQKLCHSETKCHLARSVVSFTNRSWKPGSYDYQVHTCHLIMHQSRLAIANFTRRVPQRVSVCGLESLVNWKLVAALWCAASHQPAQAFPFNFLLLVPTQFSHPKLLLILSK